MEQNIFVFSLIIGGILGILIERLEKRKKISDAIESNKLKKIEMILNISILSTFYFIFAFSIYVFNTNGTLGFGNTLDAIYTFLYIPEWGSVYIYGNITSLILTIVPFCFFYIHKNFLNSKHKRLVNQLNISLAETGFYINEMEGLVYNTSKNDVYIYCPPQKYNVDYKEENKHFIGYIFIALILSWIGILLSIVLCGFFLIKLIKSTKLESDEASFLALCNSSLVQKDKISLLSKFLGDKTLR